MSERIRGGYDDALYKWTYTLLYTFSSGISRVRVGSVWLGLELGLWFHGLG